MQCNYIDLLYLLQWAAQLLQTYRQVQREKHEKEKTKEAEMSAEEDSSGFMLTELPAGGSWDIVPTSQDQDIPSGRIHPKQDKRLSTTSSSRFVSCCSSNKSGQSSSTGQSDTPVENVDLSKMVCLRPNFCTNR